MTTQLARTIDDREIGSYLDALASGNPTPGGGSAAGLTGALGCALGSMVCNLTLAREPNHQIAELQQTLLRLRIAMLRQAEADEHVFGAYRAAIDLPRNTDEAKAARRAAIENALVAAAEVPENLIILGVEALAALKDVAAVGSSHALGDLLTGGYLIRAMIEGSLVNIEANAGLMKIASNRERFEQAAASARVDLRSALHGLEADVAARFS